MHYKLIVNQPFQSTANVLAGAFRFVRAYDPQLLRLEELWRITPDGISLYDSFNKQDLPFGRKASPEEWNPDDMHCLSFEGEHFMLLTDFSRGHLNDILDVFNDNYGGDCFCVLKTPIGYGYYKCVED